MGIYGFDSRPDSLLVYKQGNTFIGGKKQNGTIKANVGRYAGKSESKG